ncbi:hypothetical protein EV146_104457, partial [Mesobacillus foraminis]
SRPTAKNIVERQAKTEKGEIEYAQFHLSHYLKLVMAQPLFFECNITAIWHNQS